MEQIPNTASLVGIALHFLPARLSGQQVTSGNSMKTHVQASSSLAALFLFLFLFPLIRTQYVQAVLFDVATYDHRYGRLISVGTFSLSLLPTGISSSFRPTYRATIPSSLFALDAKDVHLPILSLGGDLSYLDVEVTGDTDTLTQVYNVHHVWVNYQASVSGFMVSDDGQGACYFLNTNTNAKVSQFRRDIRKGKKDISFWLLVADLLKNMGDTTNSSKYIDQEVFEFTFFHNATGKHEYPPVSWTVQGITFSNMDIEINFEPVKGQSIQVSIQVLSPTTDYSLGAKVGSMKLLLDGTIVIVLSKKKAVSTVPLPSGQPPPPWYPGGAGGGVAAVKRANTSRQVLSVPHLSDNSLLFMKGN